MSEVKMVSVERGLMERLVHLQETAERRKSTLEDLMGEAKEARKDYEEARAEVDTALKSLIRNLRGESDMPLFSQADAIERAKSDPVAAKLTERLMDAGFRVNVLQVFGYTEPERRQVMVFLDALQQFDDGEIETAPVRPAFLDEPRDNVLLAEKLAEVCVVDIPLDKLESLSDDDYDAAVAHVALVEKIHADKGGEIVMDDIPALPAFLQGLMPSDETVIMDPIVGAAVVPFPTQPVETGLVAEVVEVAAEVLPTTDDPAGPDAF